MTKVKVIRTCHVIERKGIRMLVKGEEYELTDTCAHYAIRQENAERVE